MRMLAMTGALSFVLDHFCPSKRHQYKLYSLSWKTVLEIYDTITVKFEASYSRFYCILINLIVGPPEREMFTTSILNIPTIAEFLGILKTTS